MPHEEHAETNPNRLIEIIYKLLAHDEAQDLVVLLDRVRVSRGLIENYWRKANENFKRYQRDSSH
jgi:hypothetical protein